MCASRARSPLRLGSRGHFIKRFVSVFPLTNFISYWNPCIWLAESKFVSEKQWQNAWWNAPLGPLKGPWKLWDSRLSVVQYQPYFECFLWQFFHSNFQAIHHELKSTRWKFWTGEKINSMSLKPSESNLRGELRVSEATKRGEGLGRGCPPPRAGRILHFEPEKIVSDAYIWAKITRIWFPPNSKGARR